MKVIHSKINVSKYDWLGYCDASVEEGGHGSGSVGVCIRSGRHPNNDIVYAAHIPIRSELVTSSDAELLAVYFLLKELSKRKYQNVAVINDSQSVINMIKTNVEPKNKNSSRIMKLIRIYTQRIKTVDFYWVPREENQCADALSKKPKRKF